MWHEAVDLAQVVYLMTEGLPADERFGLTAQLRRSAVSVSSNIAEGAGRGSAPELARFLRIAIGSLSELDSQLELSAKLGLLQRDPEVAPAIGRLRGRIKALHDRISGPNT